MTEQKLTLPCGPSELLKVRFINCCDKSVQILWVTFKGEYQRYNTIHPKQFLDVNTFMKHAWVFKEDISGKPVMANNKLYFYGSDEFPMAEQESAESRARCRFGVILSAKPQVKKLEKICTRFLTLHLRKCSDVKYLEIPIVLKRRLVKEMHKSNRASHSTDEDLRTCEKNLVDFSRIS